MWRLVLSALLAILTLGFVHQATAVEVEPLIHEFLDHVTDWEKVDLVTISDRSKGVGMTRFYLKHYELLYGILRQYVPVHPDYTRVAAITFGRDSQVTYDFISQDPITKCELFDGTDPPFDRIQYIDDPDYSIGTNIQEAIADAKIIMTAGKKNRPDAHQVVLMLTDGDYDPKDDPYQEVKQWQEEQNITMFCVGIGTWLETGNVRSLASKPEYYEKHDAWKDMLYDRLFSLSPDDPYTWDSVDGQYCSTDMGNKSECRCDINRGVAESQCRPGYQPSPGGDTCEECPLGTYKDFYGNEDCLECPVGTNGSSSNATSKKQCKCQALSCVDPCDDPPNPPPCPSTGRHVCLSDSSQGEGYRCECQAGWEGSDCTENTNDCRNNDCDNDAQCFDGNDGYFCACKYGFRGRHCEIDFNECRYPFCKNGGNCTEHKPNNIRCSCLPGFGGSYCQDVKNTDPPTTTTTTRPSSTVTTVTPAGEIVSPETQSMPRASSTGAPAAKVVDDGDNEDDDMTVIYIAGAVSGGVLILIIIIIVIVLVLARRRREKEREEKEKQEVIESTKSIAHRFSGFWKKLTVRGRGSFYGGTNSPRKGLPSVPPRRRPELFSNDQMAMAENQVEETYMTNQAIEQAAGGMEGWDAYLKELQVNGSILLGCIAKLTGDREAKTSDWQMSLDEITRLEIILEGQEVDVPSTVQGGEYHIRENDGECAVGFSIGGDQLPQVLVFSKAKHYMVVCIADRGRDNGQCKKEVLWLIDHITTEGY